MRLFLSDDFIAVLTKLPKKIQEKVINFQRKFRENNTTNGIHLEPIAQFKDQSLRTARVDDNYRVMMGVLNGDNYWLLYVADHENAYRWGMRKRFAWNENTHACQIVTIEEKTEEVVVPTAPATE